MQQSRPSAVVFCNCLQVVTQCTSAVGLEFMAFPAIQKLELDFRESKLEPALLAALQNSNNLSSLALKDFRLPEGAASPAAAALAQIAALKELSLTQWDYGDLGAACLTQQVSSLTALRMNGNYTDGFNSAIVKAAAHIPNLQDLQIGHVDMEGPTAAQVADLLAACPSLTVLNLELADLDDQGLEAVLHPWLQHHQPEPEQL
jgi:hypothetical protein